MYKAELLGQDTKVEAIRKKMQKLEIASLREQEKEVRRQIAEVETELKKRLITKEEALAREAALYKKLLDLDKKRLALLKQTNNADMASAKEMQAVMELRGSFFSQFAGNIFGQSAGGLTLQVGQGQQSSPTVNLNQHNTFHEPPQDPHYFARQMRRHAAGALAGL
jgi:hypothetical protein